MNEALTISSQKPQDPALDYDELRKLGITHIEETASAIWTDYNVHDPGITTLELLCYAITDLGYRINNSIPDLLATPTDTRSNILSHFFTAAKIFPNAPVTINDFRQVLIDIEGVKNAWLRKRSIRIFADITNKKLQWKQPSGRQWEPVDIKGYYDVLLEFDTNIPAEGKQAIKDEARSVLMQNRNLCENFLSVDEVETQGFLLCSELEVKPDADPFDAVAKMFFNIQIYLTPLIKFYWLKDLLAEGYTSDVIFEGPLLEHGFIKDDELLVSDLKTEIHLSDIMQQILRVDGMSNILDVIFNPTTQDKELENKWIIPVQPGKQPVIDILASNVLVYKNGIPLRPDRTIIKARFDSLMNDHITGNDLVRSEDISFDTGTFLDSSNYYSFQNHYPKTYGISHWGLPGDATQQRRAQAKQLQGYLYFFDQQLANYYSQVSHFRNLFSTESETSTYFSQVVRSFKDSEDLFIDKNTIDADIIAATETPEIFVKRRNLFLDHLLSRFSESFYDYVNILYTGISYNTKDVVSPAVINPQDIIQDKASFLKNYPEYSSKRFLGYNYTDKENVWDTYNISGLEKRLERLLGFDNLNRRNLVNLLTSIEHGLNEFNNDEYWFRITDHRNGKILLEGTTKFASHEEAAFELEDALHLIYNPVNFKIIQNPDQSFAYQLLKDDTQMAISFSTYPGPEAASADQNELILFVTKQRADEGMFLIEHSLLLPPEVATENPPDSPPEAPTDDFDGFLPICVDTSCKDCDDKDPYSFRISVILPAYAPRLLNLGFRQYCERTIRMEAPAHTFVKICWVSNEQLSEFQEAYQDWLNVKAGNPDDPGNIKLNRFVRLFTALRSIYLVARLEDCKSSEERTLFLLNQNALGTLKT